MRLWCVLPLGLLLGCAQSPLPEPENPILAYRSWKKVTPEPLDMAPYLSALCMGPDRTEVAPNPHTPRVFLVFVNSVGEKAMLKPGRGNFPDGTIIVKEKYTAQGERWARSKPLIDEAHFELATVMEKRKGEWHYSVLTKERKLLSVKVDTCRNCHLVNKKNDYVFRGYVKGALVESGGFPDQGAGLDPQPVVIEK